MTSSVRAWYALAVLVLATLFAFVDQQILVIIIDPLKHDLALRDVQIGELRGLAFALFSVVAAIPLAWCADRFERSRVLLGCVLFWSLATAACGFATSFGTLFASTVGVAIGEAALVPIVYSLIPDLFPGPNRLRANIIYYASYVLGIGLGLGLAGLMLGWVESARPLLPQGLRALAGWRLTFMAVALPGPLIALGVGLIGKTRRVARPRQGNPSTDRLVGYYCAHRRTVLGVYLGAGFGQVAATAFFAWLPAALARAFDLAPGMVGATFGVSYAVGAGVGLSTAVVTTPLWRRWAGLAAVPRANSVVCVFAIIPTLLLGVVVYPWQAYVLVATLMWLLITGLALTPSLYQEMAPPAILARVIAGLTISSYIVGAAGPIMVGALSDRWGGTARGLLWAIVFVMSLGLVLSALCYRATESPFRRTYAVLQFAQAERIAHAP